MDLEQEKTTFSMKKHSRTLGNNHEAKAFLPKKDEDGSMALKTGQDRSLALKTGQS